MFLLQIHFFLLKFHWWASVHFFICLVSKCPGEQLSVLFPRQPYALHSRQISFVRWMPQRKMAALRAHDFGLFSNATAQI